MSKSRAILTIAAVIALLPFLGFPHSWEAFFQVVGGLGIIGISEWSRIDRKLALKAKAHLRQRKAAQAKTEPVSQTLAPAVQAEPLNVETHGEGRV